MRRPFVISILLCSLRVFAASPEGAWSGSFAVADWHGGLVLRLQQADGAWRAEASVQPLGRTASPKVENLRVHGADISFDLAVEGQHLTFAGHATAGRLDGRVHSGPSIGHWTAVKLAPHISAGELPAPTGRFPIGRMSLAWTDHGRPEPESPVSGDRRVLVHIWYPAATSTGCDSAPYFPDLSVMQASLPTEVGQTVPRVKVPACSGVAVGESRPRYPVLIFAGGDEFKTLGYSALQDDLASHGYVVVAIEFPFNAPVVVFPDGSVVRPLPPESRPQPASPKSQEEAQRRQFEATLAGIDSWAHDIVFVTREIATLNATSDSLFYQRLDLTRVGVFGHSRGGLAAFRACQIDSSIRACANLDGRYRERPYPISSPADAPHQPFLWVRGPVHFFTDSEMTEMGITPEQFRNEMSLRDSILGAVASGSDVLFLDEIGFDHLDFTDFRVLETGLSAEDRAARERVLAITRAYLLAFFDASLLGTHPALLSKPGTPRQFPDVNLIQFSSRQVLGKKVHFGKLR